MADLPKLTKLVIAEWALNTGLLLLLLHNAASNTVIRVNKCPNLRPRLSLPLHTHPLPSLSYSQLQGFAPYGSRIFISLGNIYLAKVLNKEIIVTPFNTHWKIPQSPGLCTGMPTCYLPRRQVRASESMTLNRLGTQARGSGQTSFQEVKSTNFLKEFHLGCEPLTFCLPCSRPPPRANRVIQYLQLF